MIATIKPGSGVADDYHKIARNEFSPAMQGEEGYGEENLRPRKAGYPPHAVV
jgi:hypothetical protein